MSHGVKTLRHLSLRGLRNRREARYTEITVGPALVNYREKGKGNHAQNGNNADYGPNNVYAFTMRFFHPVVEVRIMKQFICS